MNTGAATLKPEDPWKGLAVPQAERAEPLRECVRSALRYYLYHLGDHEVNDLHQLVMREVERPMIETMLEHTQGNQTHAARMLGMSRSTLRKKMAGYGINRET